MKKPTNGHAPSVSLSPSYKVVLWQNSVGESSDLFGGEVFFDFFRPLEILEGDGWSRELRLVDHPTRVIMTVGNSTGSAEFTTAERVHLVPHEMETE